MLIFTPPHTSKETNEIEENKAMNVHLKFSLIFVCSQVRRFMAMLHKRSFVFLGDSEILFNALPSFPFPFPFPMFPSPYSLPFPFPSKPKIWHCLALNLLYNGVLMCMVQVGACEVNFYGYCGKFDLWMTGNVFLFFVV